MSRKFTWSVIVVAVLAKPLAAQVISVDPSGVSLTYCTFNQDRKIAGTREPSLAFRESFERAGMRYGISPDLLDAVARQESHYDPRAISPKGAIGIMQLMPATARALGVDPYDVEQNIAGGAAYLRYLLNVYDGRIDLVLSAYNGGQGAIARYGGVPPFGETKTYLLRNFDYLAQKADLQSQASPERPVSGYIRVCRR